MALEHFHIRQAEVQDAPIVTQLVVALLTELSGKPINDDDLKTYTQVCQALLREKEMYIAFLAEDATGKRFGVITLGKSAAIYTGGIFGIIHELYVVPKARSVGVGQELLLAASQYGKRYNWQRLEVGAPDESTWARTVTFYRRQGFLEIGPRLKLNL
jgi:GNAT superfamily N-acetyltransferase